MLENVGSRFGVGPAILDRDSSQAAPVRIAVRARAVGQMCARRIRGRSSQGGKGALHGDDHRSAGRAVTTSVAFMSSWPLPQYSEQRISNSPAAVGVNS